MKRDLARNTHEHPLEALGLLATDSLTPLDFVDLEGDSPWRRWGPYLAERQWGTVREDYSADGDAWNAFPHDHARSRAYRWGEDGLLGICDDRGLLCFSLALWNETDPILKERLFGLTGHEGNHGEDVKEVYYFLDATPTHTYMKALYLYPQRAFPYDDLIAENARRGKHEPEYELADTGVFADNRYFDVLVEYAKAAPEDLLIRISATNVGPDPAPLHLLPTLWFRNTWSWGIDDARPVLRAVPAEGMALVHASHDALGDYWLACDGNPDLLFTENETNSERLWSVPNHAPYVKDGINDAVVGSRREAVNPAQVGTKVAAHYTLTIAPGATETILLRLSTRRHEAPFADAAACFARRIAAADRFHERLAREGLSDDERLVQRQAFAGLLWSKQFYRYDVDQWLRGDPAQPSPPVARLAGRNRDWRELNSRHVISMPDSWEYPWFAAWDLAFHCVPLAMVDPPYARQQLLLMLGEWYMHPNGQIPACEWNFSDVNPPVHAWAALRVYELGAEVEGREDDEFLELVFHKLLLNFGWWVNRKDSAGRNVFQGGFLGLDNIGIFNRSAALPTGGYLEQSDGTAWMGMYCLDMLKIALILARNNPNYQGIAFKFLEHFWHIALALNNIGGDGTSLWDADDCFFYDILNLPDGSQMPLRVRSLVGLIPLLAVETTDISLLNHWPQFREMLDVFHRYRIDARVVTLLDHNELDRPRGMLSLVRGERLRHVLRRMFDPDEFLSDYGIRSLSRQHRDQPYEFVADGSTFSVAYDPAESTTGMFGGNSNWRGPIWFPINYMLIESLRRYHAFYGDAYRIEYPTGSGVQHTLAEIADDLSRRLVSIFTLDAEGERPVFGRRSALHAGPGGRERIQFYEYFNGDTGAGLGASHQTGWTALVATLLGPRPRTFWDRDVATRPRVRHASNASAMASSSDIALPAAQAASKPASPIWARTSASGGS